MAIAANRTSTAIEFIVKPKDDLFLEGTLRTLPRVTKGEPYPCQMQKNQTFSCLFRHYAKHNGLKKEDLVFYFVDELLPDQMPETVHLMPQDEIWVEHRVQPSPKVEEAPALLSNDFSKQFRVLLDKSTHSDMTFIVGDEKQEFYVHKAILSARSSYFEVMFRPGGMSESAESKIEIERHDKESFRRMLEFIYTAEILKLDQLSATEIIALLEISHQYLLDDLTSLAEAAACKIVTQENIGKFMLLCATYNTLSLRDVCKRFISVHGTALRQDASFRQEIEQSAELGLLILDAMQEEESSSSLLQAQSSKRKRVTESSSGHEMVPDQAGGANTIGVGNPEQW